MIGSIRFRVRGFLESTTGRRLFTPMWVIVVTAGLLSFVIFLVRAFYLRYRPDPDFLSFIATIAECASFLSVGSLILMFLGLKEDRQEQFEAWLDDKIRKWPIRFVIACVVLLSASVMAIVLYVRLPNSARIYNDRGVQLLNAGQTSEAIRQLRVAISLKPTYPQAYVNLGLAYETFFDIEWAIEAYQIALEQDAALDVAYINLGYLYLRYRGDYDSAITILRAGEPLVQDDVRHALQKNLGWAHCEKGLYKAALADLQRAVELKSDYYEAYALMAQVYIALGDSAAAQNAWESVLRYAPPDSEEALVARHRLQSPDLSFDERRCTP